MRRLCLFEKMLAKRKKEGDQLKGDLPLNKLLSSPREYALLDVETALMEYGEFQCIPGLSARDREGKVLDEEVFLNLARDFEASGACAVALYLDEEFYGTTYDHLKSLKNALEIPILCRGTFFFKEQVAQAFLNGADGITLANSVLAPQVLVDLHEMAVELGMTSIPEIQSIGQMEAVTEIDPEMFAVDWSKEKGHSVAEWESLFEEFRRLPKLAVEVEPVEDAVDKVAQCGFDGMLLAPELLHGSNPAAKMANLLERAREGRDR